MGGLSPRVSSQQNEGSHPRTRMLVHGPGCLFLSAWATTVTFPTRRAGMG